MMMSSSIDKSKLNPFMQRYEVNLDHLHKVLSKCTSPKTAKELAKILRCSSPTVYARIEALEARGVKIIRTGPHRAGVPGVKPVAFSLEKTVT